MCKQNKIWVIQALKQQCPNKISASGINYLFSEHHPLQVVAVVVFLALGFAFYIFFAPFVGNNLLQYIAIGLYTPLITCAFSLHIWCAAADPADPGVFKSKKYLKIPDSKNHVRLKESKLGGESTSSIQDANAFILFYGSDGFHFWCFSLHLLKST